MIDLEKLRIDYERKVKEVEVANAIEQETGIEPSVFTMQGRLHVYFGKIKSDAEAGHILEHYEATFMEQTYKQRNTWHLCFVRFSVGDNEPYLEIKWEHNNMDFTVKVPNAKECCIYNRFLLHKGTRRVTTIEAESGFMMQRYGKAMYNHQISRFVFNGAYTEFQGGTVLSEEPAICDSIVTAFIEKYHESK